MRTSKIIVFLIFASTTLSSYCQEYKIDTLFIHKIKNDKDFFIPYLRHEKDDVELKINNLIDSVILENIYMQFDNFNKKHISEISSNDLKNIRRLNFSILYFRNKIISIEFLFDKEGWATPYIFRKTFDFKNQRLLNLDDMLEPSLSSKFYEFMNLKIEKDVNEMIAYVKEEDHFSNNRDYMIECYKGYLNQTSFGFYIEDINKSLIVEAKCCCTDGEDPFYGYSLKFNEINKYLKKEYQLK